MRITKQCLVCGEIFETGGKGGPNHRVVYCSRRCAAIGRGVGLRREPEQKICPVCGSKFLVGSGNKPLGTRYCSQPCATAALKMPEIAKQARSGKVGRPAKADKITITCKQCGKQWEQYAWKKNNKDYCSRSCFHKSRIGAPHQHLIRPPDEIQCRNCGESFLVGGEGRPRRTAVYCSKTCAKTNYWAHKNGAHSPAREMSESEVSWFAGLFDGEGCIAWPRRIIHQSVRLDVPSTSKALLDRVAEVTGTGRIAPYKPTGNPRHSPAWGWHCYGDNARSILHQIYPWLIIKKEAAAVALGLVQVAEPPWTQRTRSTRAAQAAE